MGTASSAPAEASLEPIVLTAACAAALLVAPVTGGAVHDAPSVGAVSLIAALAVAYGRPLTKLLQLPALVPRHLVAVIVGFCAVSLVHLGATAFLNIDAMSALVVDVAGAVVLTVIARRLPPLGAASVPGGGLAAQALVLLACAGLVTVWARETITAVPQTIATGTFPAWQDYFLHAAEISYMRDYPAFDAHSQYLTAVPQPLYHRASYTMAAVLSVLGGVPALSAATAFWMPAGLLLCVVATYAWGAAMGTPLTGLAAVAAAFLVPDASTYGLENRFLSFHWLLQMAAGSGFALALTLTALALVAIANRERAVHALAAAMVLVIAGAGFRVHVSLLSTVMVVVLALLTVRITITARTVAVGAVAAALGFAILVWMESVALAPHILSGGTSPRVFFVSVLTQASALPSPYVGWTAGRGELVAFVLGYPLMLVAGCGLWLVALGLAWGGGAVGRLGWQVGAVPVALALAHMAVIRFVPTPLHGDPTDFGHRPFVLVYLVVAGLGAVGLVAWLRAWALSRWSRSTFVDAGVLAAALLGLVVPWRDGAGIQQRWTPAYAEIPVPPATLQAGDYVRRHSAPGDQILAASEDPQAVLVALTERRAYLSRTGLYRSLGPAFAGWADARAAEHAALAGISTFEELRAFGARTGVAWYVADTAASHAWPAAVTAQCAWCGDGVRVYDLRDAATPGR